MSITLVINDFVTDAAYSGFGEQIAGGRKKRYQWATDVVRYDSGKEQRNQILTRPIRHFWINWRYLDLAARNKLVELFDRAHGRYDVFKYEDNLDYAATYTNCIIALTTGDTTTQLVKTYYVGETNSWTENKLRIQPSGTYAPTIKVDAATKTEGVDFTLDDETGIITWTGFAPTTGEILTADYQFYYPVRFDTDEFLDREHMQDYWEANDLHLVEVI